MWNFADIKTGRIDAAPTLQEILDKRGEIRIPSGKYLLGDTLRVHSDTTIIADQGARFVLRDGGGKNNRSFLLSNANPGNGNANITVRGGLWDGNNAGNPRGADYDPFGYSGVAVSFINVRNLSLGDMTVYNPESFFIRIGEVTNFRIERIRLRADMIRPNQDGIHVGGYSQNGVICNIRASGVGVPNDDMIALNADDDVERQLNIGLRRGPIRDVRVEDIEAEDAYTFVRLLSVDKPIEGITIRRLRGSCRIHGININNWRFPKGVGNIRSVLLEDIELAKTQVSESAPAIVKVCLAVDDLRIRDFRRSAASHPDALTLFLDNASENRVCFDSAEIHVPRNETFNLATGDIPEFSVTHVVP